MTSNWRNSGGGCGAVCDRPGVGPARRKAPRVIVRGGQDYAQSAAEALRDRGWDVSMAEDDLELHALAVQKNPTAVLIPATTWGDSGYLTCAKLRLTRPRLKVVLVGEVTPAAQEFATFVGARYTSERDAADLVAKLI